MFALRRPWSSHLGPRGGRGEALAYGQQDAMKRREAAWRCGVGRVPYHLSGPRPHFEGGVEAVPRPEAARGHAQVARCASGELGRRSRDRGSHMAGRRSCRAASQPEDSRCPYNGRHPPPLLADGSPSHPPTISERSQDSEMVVGTEWLAGSGRTKLANAPSRPSNRVSAARWGRLHP